VSQRNTADADLRRHHVFVKVVRDVQLAEVGPRFEMKRERDLIGFIGSQLNACVLAYEIRQGTIEQTEAEREWVLAHYARTAKKRNLLSGPAAHSTADSDRPSSKRQKR
jgi:U3 small nucleolar ribonucleoprotein protein IMP4